MPLPFNLTKLAEREVYLWAAETGMRLRPTGYMRDQYREMTAETLYRRMQIKYPDDMRLYSLDDLKESVFADDDSDSITEFD